MPARWYVWLELCAFALICLNVFNATSFFRQEWAWTTFNDVRQSLFVMDALHRPELFVDDPVATLGRSFGSPALQAAYWLLGWFTDAVISSKLVGLAVTTSTLILLTVAARDCFGWRTTSFWLTLVLATGGTWLWVAPVTGLNRGFEPALALLALIAFRRSSDVPYLAAVLASGVTAPTVLVFLAVLAPVRWFVVHGVPRTAPELRTFAASALCGVAVFALAAGIHLAWRAPVVAPLGPVADYDLVQGDPSFNEGGRWQHERIRPLRTDLAVFSRRSLPVPVRLAPLTLAVIVVAGPVGLGLAFLFRLRSPRSVALLSVVSCFVVTSVVAWGLARLFALQLYFPDRYLRPSTLPLLFGFVAILSLPVAVSQSASRAWRQVAVGVTGLGVLLAILLGGYRTPLERYATLGDPEQRELLTYLREDLGATDVVAGNPWTMDDVPLFSQRAVWVNAEASLPLYPSHHDLMARRTRQLIPAYFAWEARDVERWFRASSVTHLVVSRADFLEGAVPWARERRPEAPYLEPFSREISSRIADKPASARWVWDRLPARAVLFTNRRFVVVDLSAWLDA